MPDSSITGTDCFGFRAQRSEETRLLIIASAFGIAVIGNTLRRLLGGAVMASNAVYFPTVSILGAAILYELWVLSRARRASSQGRLIPTWRWQANACFELAVPASFMLILHLNSPRGEYAALSAPVILVFPVIILLSVLRLRPRFTLATGAGAALFHWALAAHALAVGSVPPHQGPVVFTYGVILLVTGLAASAVSRAVRRYVLEAVDEATQRERAGRRLAAMEHDLDIARDIQRGLLPEASPEFPGFDLAGMNRPADKTGGDYYDWQLLPDGRLLVVMADVTGHGIGPALVMAVCRAYSRASAPLDSSPASLLARLNNLLASDLRGGRFITLAMALIDADGHVELVSAGHGPSILYRAASRQTQQFGGDGLPLAVLPDETYGPSRSFTLEPGDALILLTDGVFEWPNRAGKQFGTERLSQAISGAAHLPARALIDSLDRAVRTFVDGAPQTDDLTIVVIRRPAI